MGTKFGVLKTPCLAGTNFSYSRSFTTKINFSPPKCLQVLILAFWEVPTKIAI